MMNSIRVVCTVFMVAFCSALFANNNHGVHVGDKAPDFVLKRQDGSAFKLSDYQGKKAVNLIFWATWCSNCKAEIPFISLIHQAHASDIEVLAINVDINDSPNRVTHYLDKHKIQYPVSYDFGSVVSKQYGVLGTPTQLLIDINGMIAYRDAESPRDLTAHLDKLLGRE